MTCKITNKSSSLQTISMLEISAVEHRTKDRHNRFPVKHVFNLQGKVYKKRNSLYYGTCLPQRGSTHIKVPERKNSGGKLQGSRYAMKLY
jgi:hypothetical protein